MIGILLLLAAATRLKSSEKKKKRRNNLKTWLKQKERFSHMNLLQQLKENNPDDFKNYLRFYIP